ncbi:WYL domain-containing protein [Desulfuromonas carbonis]
MLQLLETRQPKDAALIRERLEAEGFKVDLRTVQRDLRELCELFPITFDNSKPIAWRWDRHAMSFDIPGMDRTAALTLKMVNEFMARLLPKSCLESLAPNLRRADRVLGDLGNRGFGSWPEKVRVVTRTQPLQPPEIASGVLEVIYEALLDDLRFKGQYRKKGASKFEDYVVNPLGLVFAEPLVYLVATLWNYDDIKLLPLHRFGSVELITEPVLKPKGFQLDKYLEQGELNFPMPGRRTIRLKVLFEREAAAHLLESPLSADQKITECDDDEVMLEATVLDTHQLRWWLLGFGDQVEIVAPKSLRREFAETARNMLDSYGDY